MSEQARGPREVNRAALFIEGYLDSRFKSDKRPTYGYPKNHLPDAGDQQMQVVTSFGGARKGK